MASYKSLGSLLAAKGPFFPLSLASSALSRRLNSEGGSPSGEGMLYRGRWKPGVSPSVMEAA